MLPETPIGITAFGAYVPAGRLQRQAILAANSWFNPGLKAYASGERSISNWDEDPITMGVEAARDCLSDINRAALTAILFASTTMPFADRQNSVIMKEGLTLNDSTAALDVSGSQRAGTSALLQSHAAALLAGGPVLCVAGDKRRALPASESEMLFGDAAAAFVIGRDRMVARLLCAQSSSVDFVDHFRHEGRDTDYGWESRWVRDEGYAKLIPAVISAVLLESGCSGGSIDKFVCPIASRGVAAAVAKQCGLSAQSVCSQLNEEVGDTGAAHPLLLLAHVLETARPGEKVLVVGFGSGCDVMLYEVQPAIDELSKRRGVSGWLRRRRSETNYLKFLAHAGMLPVDRGMRAEFDQKQALTALYRNRRTVLGLVATRYKDTGTVQFPPSEIGLDGGTSTPANREDYPLADKTARIITFTADNLTYTPDPPAYYGTIEFDGGGRMSAEFCDACADDMQVGRTMRMMFRIKSADEQRGFIKYFWKAAPAD